MVALSAQYPVTTEERARWVVGGIPVDMTQKGVSRTLATLLGLCQHFRGKWVVFDFQFLRSSVGSRWILVGKRCDLEHHLCCHHTFSGVPTTKGLCFSGVVYAWGRDVLRRSRGIYGDHHFLLLRCIPIQHCLLPGCIPARWENACGRALRTLWRVKTGEGMPPTCETSSTCR